MKIIQYITRMDEIGGAQRHVLDLSTGLIRCGHEVIVISSGYGALTEELKKRNIPYYSLKNLAVDIHPIKDFQNSFELRKLLKIHRPDLIAIHSSKSGVIGRIMSRTLRIPAVFTVHGCSFSNEPLLKFSLYLFIERLVGRIPTGIISVSHYDHHLINTYLKKVHTERIVIHNGIPDTLLLAEPKDAQQKTELVMVARFAEPKDHKLLIQALSYLPENVHWRLTLIGDGPLKHQTKKEVDALGFSNQVSFLGEVQQIESILQQADIFLLITKSEGLPISIIEAMRARLAIIATNVGGVSELIDHQQNGLLIQKSNAQDLAAALQLLITDFPKRQRYAYRAREKYEQNFSFKTMLHKTEQYYLKTIKEYPIKRKVGV